MQPWGRCLELLGATRRSRYLTANWMRWHRSEWEPDWVSKEPTPSKEPKEAECLEPDPCLSGVAPGPSCVEQGLPTRMAGPKPGPNETMELLSRVFGAGDEDSDPSALSAVLKAKLRLYNLNKPPPTMSPSVEPLTRDVKSCGGIRSSAVDTCPSPFHVRVRTVPFCSVGDTTEGEMKIYVLAALAPLVTTQPSTLSGGIADPGVPGRGTNAIAMANLRIKISELDPKSLPE